MGYTRSMGKRYSALDVLFLGCLFLVWGGIVLHAPLSVGLSTIWPHDAALIKSWKEIILGIALLAGVVKLTLSGKWRVVGNKYIVAILAFALLNVMLVPLFVSHTGMASALAGLLINLRFLLFFSLVFIAVKLYPGMVRPFLWVFAAGATVVIGFALLQLTVLPKDALKYIGYDKTTIMPYLTVDQNQNYVRINSTLRGPNPLGLYATVVLSMVLAVWFRVRRVFRLREKIGLWFLGGGAVVALWASYSRSAVLAALLAVVCILFAVYGRRLTKGVWLGLAAVALVLGGSLVVFRDTQFVSQVILHQDPLEGNNVNSNDGHAHSIADGTRRLIVQPLGGGVGSTGSASLYGASPLIIENEYLFVAHENGWAGLGLFVVITYFVLAASWRRRRSFVALAVFASGVGIAFAGLFLPVWTDDTVSIVWWGLAALVVAMPVHVAAKDGVKIRAGAGTRAVTRAKAGSQVKARGAA